MIRRKGDARKRLMLGNMQMLPGVVDQGDSECMQSSRQTFLCRVAIITETRLQCNILGRDISVIDQSSSFIMDKSMEILFSDP